MKREIIKYQWTDKQRTETLAILEDLKKLVYETEIWSQKEETPQHAKHEVRCVLGGLIKRVKDMRKITEEY